ncbi:MAG: hypothetical protein ACXQS3_04520 [Candidatus Methanofastidiosia archaeon]
MINTEKKELLILKFLNYAPITGRKRFQKLMYLAKNKYSVNVPFIFTKHFYGPYSREMQEVIDSLELFGYIKERNIHYDQKVVYNYEITEKGKKILELMADNSDDAKINSFLEEYKRFSTNSIVEEAYELAGIRKNDARD